MDTVTILGATGYTGRLCAAEAVRRKLPVQIAGRRRDELARLGQDLGVTRIEVVDVDDRRSLATLAEQSSVLVTTVGPYATLGAAVLEAAIAGGCHYLDISGEVPFLAWAYDQGDRAGDAGVALCPGFGFDGVPGELLAFEASQRLHGTTTAVRLAYRLEHIRASRGTLRSGIGVIASGGRAWVGGRMVREPIGRVRWDAPFTPPNGTLPTLSIPLPEVVTVPRSTGAADVRTYATTRATRFVRPLVAPLSAVGGALLRSPLRSAVDALARRLPEGPDDEARLRAASAFIAEVSGVGGPVYAWARAADIYGTTARIAMGAARRLLEGPPRTGALTPSQLVDGKAAEFLDELGATWGVG